MRTAFRVLGWILAVLAAGLFLLGVMSMPPGGLMFALPFVFFYPAFLFVVLAAVLLFLTRRRTGN